jgi:hypothetical protein
VIQRGEPHLLEIIGALHAPGGLACRLNGREQQRDQYSNDRDHDEQLDKRKRFASALAHHGQFD